MDEVTGLVGDADQILRNESRGDTLWVYRYEKGPGTFLTIVLFVLVVTIIVFVVIMLSYNDPNAIPDVGTPRDASKGSHAVEFRVQFNAEGRVIGISPVYAGE